jgi:hypothetical protein
MGRKPARFSRTGIGPHKTRKTKTAGCRRFFHRLYSTSGTDAECAEADGPMPPAAAAGKTARPFARACPAYFFKPDEVLWAIRFFRQR